MILMADIGLSGPRVKHFLENSNKQEHSKCEIEADIPMTHSFDCLPFRVTQWDWSSVLQQAADLKLKVFIAIDMILKLAIKGQHYVHSFTTSVYSSFCFSLSVH